mgnify:CR=1 FL=1
MLKWKQDGELHFAHASYGMWMIEQRRGRFLITLTLKGTRDADQDYGYSTRLAGAKRDVDQAHRALSELEA